ncbi:unnamed protein product [Protopolystoma xenopodis]|uniref:Secreted protein n=1 Tax=Protopolystoma xenopodis TaxID=117903 RepID=A0A3S5FEN0_9PLAT|nr:unnamed protein product [Protopolystoma xenopodis]
MKLLIMMCLTSLNLSNRGFCIFCLTVPDEGAFALSCRGRIVSTVQREVFSLMVVCLRASSASPPKNVFHAPLEWSTTTSSAYRPERCLERQSDARV